MVYCTYVWLDTPIPRVGSVGKNFGGATCLTGDQARSCGWSFGAAHVRTGRKAPSTKIQAPSSKEAPSSKLQAPKKHQAPSSKYCALDLHRGPPLPGTLRLWCFFGAWCLGF